MKLNYDKLLAEGRERGLVIKKEDVTIFLLNEVFGYNYMPFFLVCSKESSNTSVAQVAGNASRWRTKNKAKMDFLKAFYHESINDAVKEYVISKPNEFSFMTDKQKSLASELKELRDVENNFQIDDKTPLTQEELEKYLRRIIRSKALQIEDKDSLNILLKAMNPILEKLSNKEDDITQIVQVKPHYTGICENCGHEV